MKKFKIAALIMFLFNSLISSAQNVEMADNLKKSGKIYVVVGVIVIIFTGIVAFLIHLERRISKMEREASTK